MKLGEMLVGIEAGRSLACEARPPASDEWAVIKVSAMTSGVFRPEEAKPLPAHVIPDSRHEIHPGDLLISRANTTEYVGASVLVGSVRERLLLSDKSLRLRVKPHVDPRWLQHMLSSPPIRGVISRAASGTKDSMRNISQGALLALDLPEVPMEEQRRIVAVLEDHLSRLDAAESCLRAAASRQSKLVAAVLRTAVVSDVTHVPLRRLLAEPLANGRSVPDGDGARVLRLTALKSSTVDTNASKQGAWPDAEAAPFLIREDDLLLARGNGSLDLVGRAAIVPHEPPPVAFPDTMIRVRPDGDAIRPALLLLLWNSGSVRRQIEAVVRTTAGIYKINQKQLLDISVPLPSPRRQDQALREIRSVADDAERLASASSAAASRCQGLRRLVLTAAFTGRL